MPTFAKRASFYGHIYGLEKLFGFTLSKSLNKASGIASGITVQFPQPLTAEVCRLFYLFFFFCRHTLCFQDLNYLLVKSHMICYMDFQIKNI